WLPSSRPFSQTFATRNAPSKRKSVRWRCRGLGNRTRYHTASLPLVAPWRRGTTAGAQASSSKSSLGKPRSSPSPRVAIAIRHPALSSCRFSAWDGNSERQSFSGTSNRPFRHHAVDRPDPIKLRGFMKFVGVPLAEMLLDIIRAGRLDEHQGAAPEAAAHHPRADHLRHPGSQLHEAVKLPAAYREIEAKALVRRIEDWAEAPRRTAAQGVRRPQHPGILGDHVPSAVPLNRIGDPLQVV